MARCTHPCTQLCNAELYCAYFNLQVVANTCLAAHMPRALRAWWSRSMCVVKLAGSDHAGCPVCAYSCTLSQAPGVRVLRTLPVRREQPCAALIAGVCMGVTSAFLSSLVREAGGH
jgi:hypothetical protein